MNFMLFDQLLYQTKRPYHFFKTGLLKGLPAEIRYSFPSRKLKVIVITGTDGKTTSATMLYHVLQHAGKKVALLSTVAAYIGDKEIDTGFHVTSPEPDKLQQLMAEMVDQGIEYLVMEATSHGIYQYRTWGISPFLAGVTNVTHEHLDYHVTYQNYFEAKAEIVAQAPVAIVNADDDSISLFRKKLKQTPTKLKTYSQSDRIYSKVVQAINDHFPEPYNRMNARLVYALSQELAVSNQEFIEAIQTFPGVPGRMQEVPTTTKFRVIVDFAHTPNALKEALNTLSQQLDRPRRSGKLIAVYGCAGLRDRQKRSMMGKVGVEMADLVVFTAEDPRTEDIWSIIRQMKENLTRGHQKIVSIPDRKEAIQFALTQLAQPGDIVGIFGKGHEKSMCYGTTEYPWSDVAVASEILSKLP